MKKIIVGIMIAFALLCTGCSSDTKSVEGESDGEETSMFVIVEKAPSWNVVYNKETKVMYAVSKGSYNRGTFTVLVNLDGTPMIYGEDY